MKVVTVGRSSENDILIQNDGYVGRTHCEFIQDDNGNCYVVDLNSKNGTYVNGVRITGKTRLQSHDTVRIGNTTLPWKNYFRLTQSFVPNDMEVSIGRSSAVHTPCYENKPLIDIPSEMNINKVERHEIFSADVRKKGDDFQVGFLRNMGDNIGNHLGNAIGCIGSIILVIIFIAVLTVIAKGCS